MPDGSKIDGIREYPLNIIIYYEISFYDENNQLIKQLINHLIKSKKNCIC